jgi:TnpA family transposase
MSDWKRYKEGQSTYVIDGLMRNDVVKSDIHSTDTHGFSEAIFAVTHLLGVSFAPRIKNLKSRTCICSGHAGAATVSAGR